MEAFDDEEIVLGFIQESREHLATIETDLLEIEKAGTDSDPELVNKVFRAAHSIKGGAGFLGFKNMQEIGHKAESILDLVRSGKIPPSPEVVNVLLIAFDQLNSLLDQHERSDQVDVSAVTLALTDLLTSFLEPEAKAEISEYILIAPPGSMDGVSVSHYDLSHTQQLGQNVYLISLDLIHDLSNPDRTPLLFVNELNSAGDILGCRLSLESAGTLEDPPTNQIAMEVLYATIIEPDFIDALGGGLPPEKFLLLQDADGVRQRPEYFQPAAPAPEKPVADTSSLIPRAAEISQPPQPSPAKEARRMPRAETQAPEKVTESLRAEETLRVKVHLLEELMNLAGELVLGRNQLSDAVKRNDIGLIRASNQQLSMITSDLQDTIMQTRMQTIGVVFAKFSRVVRDLAQSCGKSIDLDIAGGEVEMDKTIIESIADPLTHMIRNAVDHGIELPADRLASGKPETGCIAVKAYHAAGQVVIEIADDGKGLDPEVIAASALRKGVIDEQAKASLSPREKLNLIFLPGFSTAETVSELSGRGVGMDVVRTNIDRLGGKVDIESRKGDGTVFRIYLPLTLAVMPSLLVGAGNQKFALPQANIRELLRIPASDGAERLESIGEQKAIVVRDKLIPVVFLEDILGVPNPASREPVSLNVVVIQSENTEFGLVVEQLFDILEIVVRPLGRHLRSCREFSGATVLGNGEVAMILDVGGISLKGDLNRLEKDLSKAMTDKSQTREGDEGDLMQLLVFQNGEREPCAIPLNRVQRIEEFSASAIEARGGFRSTQYRGGQLPLIMLSDFTSLPPLPEVSHYYALVVSIAGKEKGLLALPPADVELVRVQIDDNHRQRGILGSCIIDGKTVLMVHLDELTATPRTLSAGVSGPLLSDVLPESESAESENKPTILLAEDSDFFRGQLERLMMEEGYAVTSAENGEAAWRLFLSSPQSYDLVVTDIEMPLCDGLELTTRIRNHPEGSDTPVIAVTTLADEVEVQRGLKAGVSEYHVKLDRETLLKALSARLRPAQIN